MTDEKKSLDSGADASRLSHPAAAADASRPDRKSGFPTFSDLLVFLGIFLAANAAGAAVAWLCGMRWPDLGVLLGDDEELRVAEQYVMARFNAVSYSVSMSATLGGLLFYRRQRGGGWGLGRFSRRGLDPVLLLWGVLFMSCTSLVIEPLLSLLPEVPNIYGRGPWAVLTLVVMAPLFEEVIFRGVLLESARARYGVAAAWIVSSVLFGVVHLHPAVAVNALFAGLILGFFYIATGSLWTSVILHAVNNALAYLMLAAGCADLRVEQMVGSGVRYYAVYAVAAALWVLFAWLTVRSLRRIGAEEKKRAEA